MQGVPTTFDLLRSLDLGRSWLDVLRSTSEIRVTRPKVPTSPGGPESVPPESGAWALTLASPSTAWFTATDEDLGGITFGSTRDGGVHWRIHSFPAVRESAGIRGRFAAAALRRIDGLRRRPSTLWTPGPFSVLPRTSGDSYLYETSDGGAAWHRLAVFG